MSLVRRPLATIVPLLTALALAGCGVSEHRRTSAPADGAETRRPRRSRCRSSTSTARRRSTKKPKQVVTLGLSDQDAVLALGVKPVGAIDWFKERPYGHVAVDQGPVGQRPPGDRR